MRKTTALVVLLIVVIGVGMGFMIGRMSGGSNGNDEPITILANAAPTGTPIATVTPPVATPTEPAATPTPPPASPSVSASPNGMGTRDATPDTEVIFIPGTPATEAPVTVEPTATATPSPTPTQPAEAGITTGTGTEVSESSLAIQQSPLFFRDWGVVDGIEDPQQHVTSVGSDGTGGAEFTPIPTQPTTESPI